MAHAYPGNKTDVTQFPDMIDELSARHRKQVAGFAQTLAKAQARLDELAATLALGKTRRTTEQLAAYIKTITGDSWLCRVLDCVVTGDTPATHRLSVSVNERAKNELEDEVFGKRILVTTHDDWPISEVVAAYRSQPDAEFRFRQLKDPHVVSFSPMHHWTEHNIRIHTFTCVLALQIAHLMRHEADRAGQHQPVAAVLDHLGGIGETVRIYPSTDGRPKARRMLTKTTETQDRLAEIFNLAKLAPKKS